LSFDRTLSAAKFNIVLLMVLFSVLSYFDRTIMSVAGPLMMHEYGISETRMGAVYSAFLLGYALMMIPGGGLVDWLGPWRTLVAMGLGASLFTALTSIGGHPVLGVVGIIPTLFVIRFLMGVCTAPLYPSCGKMNSNWFPPSRQGFVWGLVAAGAGIGSALSPSLFAKMVHFFGWRRSFLLAAAATALLTLLWAWYARDRPADHKPDRKPARLFSLGHKVEHLRGNPQASFGRILRERNVLLLSFGYLTVGYIEYIFFFWIYYYFGEIRHMPAKQTSIYSTAIFLAWVVMSPLGGTFSDALVGRFGERRGRPIVPVVGVLSGAVLFFLGIRLSTPFAVGTTLALSFGLTSSSDGAFWKATIEAGGKDVGAACGILNTGSNIGGFVAPVLTPLIASIVGWPAALNFACIVAAAGVSIWFFLMPESGVRNIVTPVETLP
jgi:ACS family glucarate transporter-like MFS transporter